MLDIALPTNAFIHPVIAILLSIGVAIPLRLLLSPAFDLTPKSPTFKCSSFLKIQNNLIAVLIQCNVYI